MIIRKLAFLLVITSFIFFGGISSSPISASTNNDSSLLLQNSPDCDPVALKEWMILRTAGRNRVQPILDNTTNLTLIQAMLLVQSVRRDLEDLKRPACADELYTLTIYLYDNVLDIYGFRLAGDTNSENTIVFPRLKHYGDTIDPIFQKLQTITGVDIMVEAAKIQPVSTQAATLRPPEPISRNGVTGGVVLDPIDIPSGTYRMILTGEGGLTVTLAPLSGTCGDTFIYIESTKQNTEEVFSSDNCRAAIQIGQTDKPWKLEFIPIQ